MFGTQIKIVNLFVVVVFSACDSSPPAKSLKNPLEHVMITVKTQDFCDLQVQFKKAGLKIGTLERITYTGIDLNIHLKIPPELFF